MNVWIQRIWVQITADRKRFGAFCVMLLVGLLLWSRVILISKPPPAAVADPRMAGVDASSPSDPSVGLDGALPELLELEEPVVVYLPQYPARDPFRIDPDYFPRPKPTSEQANLPDADKSGQKDDDDKPDPEELRTEYLRDLAGTLKLEAVMTGRPMAIINGRTCQVGDSVISTRDDSVPFTLVAVERVNGEYQAVVEAEGRQFTLKMGSRNE